MPGRSIVDWLWRDRYIRWYVLISLAWAVAAVKLVELASLPLWTLWIAGMAGGLVIHRATLVVRRWNRED